MARPSEGEPLFGTHIKEAIRVLRGKLEPKREGETVSVAPSICKGRESTAADHCWHFSRDGSGSASSDGSGHSAGKRRCCFCGFVEYWERRWGPPVQQEHGPHEPKPYEQF